MTRTWHLITGEFPPDLGGVSDYSASLARALAAAGQVVQVWCPGNVGDTVPESCGVSVHRIAGRFGPAGLARLDRELGRFAGPRTVLVQYVPHAFGWRSMNLPFALWVGGRARRGDDVRVMFHEVAFPWVRRPLRHNLLAAAHHAMAAVLVRSCHRAYISSEGWRPLLRRLGGSALPIEWTPVPSNVPDEASPAAVSARRAELTGGDPAARVVCHFGNYGPAYSRALGPVLRDLLGRRPEVRVLLLGAGGDRWRGELAGWPGRVTAPGPLPASEVSAYLRASDLMLQPYPDGASGRRTTLMAGLANGLPVVTNLGEASEPVWGQGAVAAAPVGDPGGLVGLALGLLDRPDRLAELGRAGRRLYEDRFALRHTVDVLLGPP